MSRNTRLIDLPRLIGFEELGNNDAFDTAVLELRLLHSGLCLRISVLVRGNNKISRCDF